MTISYVPNSDIPDFEYQKIINFLVNGYGKPELPRKKEEEYFAKTDYHLMLYQNKQLISYLRTVIRVIKFQGLKIKVGGIGDVCTDPRYRNLGNASTLIQSSIKKLLERKVDVIILFTDISKLGKFYGRYGFKPLKAEIKTKTKRSTPKTIKGQAMICCGLNKAIYNKLTLSEQEIDIGSGSW